MASSPSLKRRKTGEGEKKQGLVGFVSSPQHLRLGSFIAFPFFFSFSTPSDPFPPSSLSSFLHPSSVSLLPIHCKREKMVHHLITSWFVFSFNNQPTTNFSHSLLTSFVKKHPNKIPFFRNPPSFLSFIFDNLSLRGIPPSPHKSSSLPFSHLLSPSFLPPFSSILFSYLRNMWEN